MSRIDNLIAHPSDFEFFQAVRLIEASSEVDLEIIRFRSTSLLRFPIGQIDSVNRTDRNSLEIHTSCLGLYGVNGLLPHHYTELIIQLLQTNNSALKEFFDMFNHRLISLYYRAWKRSRFYVSYAEKNRKNEDCFTATLRSLVGNVQNEVLLFYAGYFSNSHRSAPMLQNLLSDYFDISMQVKSFQGRYFTINLSERAHLQISSKASRLGFNAVLGSRIWDGNHYFELSMGPLNYDQFLQFLPETRHLSALITLTLLYVGVEWNFGIRLVLKADQVPNCQIGRRVQIALGRNAWLKTKAFTHDVADTCFSVRDGKIS